MLLLHGHYKFFRRRVAVRNVWCTVCKEPRLAIGIRSIVVIHLFWIPILPIARVTDWACATCGKNPKENLSVRPASMRWPLVLAGLFVVAGLWALVETLRTGEDALAGKDTSMTDGIAGGITLIGFGILWGYMVRRQLRKTAELGFDDGKTPVASLDGSHCPLCGERLLIPGKPRCERCQVDILIK